MLRDKSKRVSEPLRAGAGKQPVLAKSQSAPVLLCKAIADAFFDLQAAEDDGQPLTTIATYLKLDVEKGHGPTEFLGIVGKCRICGCDVHILTRGLTIVRHLRVDDATPAGFEAVRQYWKAPHDGVIAVLAYTDHLELVMLDGSVVQRGGSSR